MTLFDEVEAGLGQNINTDFEITFFLIQEQVSINKEIWVFRQTAWREGIAKDASVHNRL